MKINPFKSTKSIFTDKKKKKNTAQSSSDGDTDSIGRVNKTVYLTVAVLLIVLAIAVAMTSAANRARRPAPEESTVPHNTEAPTATVAPEQTNAPECDVTTAPRPEETDAPTPETDKPASATVPTLSLPAEGCLGNEHDPTVQVYSSTLGEWRVHLGVDIMTQAGAPVLAAANGVVSEVRDDPLWGKCVSVSHDGDAVSVYKSLCDELPEGIEVGARVVEGQVLGVVGDSGITELADEPHLHFEFLIGGEAVDPLDYFSAGALSELKNATDTSFEN